MVQQLARAAQNDAGEHYGGLGRIYFERVVKMKAKPVKKRTRPHTDTTVPAMAGVDVRDIMAALLKTPPPPAGDKSTRKVKRKLPRNRPGKRR